MIFLFFGPLKIGSYRQMSISPMLRGSWGTIVSTRNILSDIAELELVVLFYLGSWNVFKSGITITTVKSTDTWNNTQTKKIEKAICDCDQIRKIVAKKLSTTPNKGKSQFTAPPPPTKIAHFLPFSCVCFDSPLLLFILKSIHIFILFAFVIKWKRSIPS